MKHLLISLALVFLLSSVMGCGEDNPTGSNTPPPPDNTATSTWNETGGYWSTVVNASDYDSFMHFSFATKDTVSGVTSKPAADLWDIAFRREVVKLNGGTSTSNNGDVVGADLGTVNFDDVTIADTSGVTWVADFIDYFIDEWYQYNPITHQLTTTRYVYSMLDASGHHYVKFQVDSMVNAAQPPDMGTVWLTYYYQPDVDSRSLPGPTSEASINVGPGTGYFDFSTGTQVTPADPSNSVDWDIAFYAYDLMQNSGPSGTGGCAAFLAWTELVDPTDIDAFVMQPSGAPLFPDIPGSVMTEWYDYNGQTHQLTSKSNVYLVKTGQLVYKLRIESYYANIGGVPTSGYYTFIWAEL